MHLNDETLDQITGKLIKKTGIEEPSSFFTEQVMQSILTADSPELRAKSQNYLWPFLVIPVLIAGGLYFSSFPKIISKIVIIPDFIGLYSIRFYSVLTNSFHQLANISISPIVIFGSIAVFILLVIEIILTKNKYQI
jgi:hypothetical protein